MFENSSNFRIWIFEFWHFLPIFVLLKSDLSGNTVWPQSLGFQKLDKTDHFCPLVMCSSLFLVHPDFYLFGRIFINATFFSNLTQPTQSLHFFYCLISFKVQRILSYFGVFAKKKSKSSFDHKISRRFSCCSVLSTANLS